MWQSFNELIIDTMLAGASNALPLLPAALQPFVNWETFNHSAFNWLQTYRSDILEAIDGTTEKQAKRIIGDWMRRGDHLDVLKTELAPIFGSTRAAAIAATEVTRLFAQGNLQLWGSTGMVSGKTWQTAVDERVCPFCGPLHGQTVELHSDFTLTADTIANSDQMRALLGDNYTLEAAIARASKLIGNVGASAPAPPYHVRCRCWLLPFVSEVAVRSQIGDILANRFFADVRSGKVQGVIVG